MTKKSLIILVLLLIGCNKPVSIDMNKELMAVDMAFSTLSKEKGMNHAFLFYVADDGVMLSPNKMPVVGKNKIGDLFQSDDSKTVFTWNPLYAEVAKSGDLGYTYGIYEILEGESRQKGTYVSVWKKDTTGEWKFVLDSGNKGLDDQ